MKKFRAFTLIELLIASSIFVVLMASIYSAFHSGIFNYRNIEKTLDIYDAARSVLERMNLDLRNSFAYGSQDGNTKFTGTKNELSFLTLADTFSEDAIRTEFAFVSYKLEEDRLLRTFRKNQGALNEESEVQPEEMASNVDVKFEYGYIPKGEKDLVFKESWPGQDNPEEQKALPEAIKVKLTLNKRTEQGFERTIFLPR